MIVVVLFHQKVDVSVVAHEPRWSLIWGFSGALMGFFARLFGTQFMLDDRKQCLEHINKTLDMKKIAHLAPKQLEANKPV